MIFKRYSGNPIIMPNSENEWESLVTCNPACIYEGGTFYLFYRCAGNDYDHKINIALATSKDGFRFQRYDKNPVLAFIDGMSDGGPEDPRIVKIGDCFIMSYAYRPYAPGQYWKHINSPILDYGCPKDAPEFFVKNLSATAFAFSGDLLNWKRMGRVTDTKSDNRDVYLFPEKINGRYVRFERPEHCGDASLPPSIWLNFSNDLMEWKQSPKFLCKPEEEWEEVKIGGSTPPVRTEKGWLCLYHGVAKDNTYRVGALILDLQDPMKILYRTKRPIFEPEFDYEKNGFVSNVVFPTAAVLVENTLYLYYGASDQYVGVATADLKAVLQEIMRPENKAE